MSEGAEEIRQIYRNYLTEELAKPEVSQAGKRLAASFSVKPAVIFEPASCAALCLLAAAFFFFYQIQPRPRAVILPDAPPPVMVKKVFSRTGSTMVYQKNHPDIPITVIWVFPGGLAK